jgi:TolB protein
MRSKYIISIVLLSLLTLLGLTFCENKIDDDLAGTLKGIVVNKIDNKPISEVAISTSPYSKTVFTNKDGVFVIDSINIGQYNVISIKNGFKSQSIAVEIRYNQTSDMRIIMDKSISSDDAPLFSDTFLPANDQLTNTINVLFNWQVINRTDTVYYNLYLYEAGAPNNPSVYSNVTDTFLLVNNLKFETYYYWQIYATNNSGTTITRIKQFKTLPFPSNQIMFSKLNNGVSQIFVSDTVGASPVQITHAKHHCWNAKINNARNAIAFESSQDMIPKLFVMNMDGSGVRSITNSQIGGLFHRKIEFSWAPNGANIIYTSYNKLYKVNADGSGLITLATASAGYNFREVTYSNDGENIYLIATGNLAKDRHIFKLSANGSNMQSIYSNSNFAISGLCVNPDNNHLLFSVDMSGFDSETGRMLDAQIHQINISSGLVSNLSANKIAGTNDLDAKYSPDGGKIVFTNSLNTLSAPPAIWIMNIDSKHRQKVFEDSNYAFWFD